MLSTTNCVSLVANNSFCNHGSDFRFASVFQCVGTLRHPHLRRQFETGGRSRNVPE